MSDSDFSPVIREAVKNRSWGRCEWCGTGCDGLDLHHRQFRSRGGNGSGSNAIGLCRHCHRRAHGLGEGDLEAAVTAGVSLPSTADPAAVPIRSVVFGFDVWLLPNGDMQFTPPSTELSTGGKSS